MNFLSNLLELSLAAAPWLVVGLLVGGLIKAVIPMSFLYRHLGEHGVIPVVKAAVFGAPLPLCSCGVIPAAMGLRQAGASKSSTISFLVSTPETGVDSVSVTYALMGPFMAIVRPIAAIISAITAGLLVGRTGESVEPARSDQNSSSCCGSQKSEETEPKVSSCCGSEPAEPEVSSCCSPEPVEETVASSSSCCGSEEQAVSKETESCCSSESDQPVQESLLKKFGQGIRYAFTDLYSNLIFWLVVGLLFAAAVKTWVPTTFLLEWGSGLPAMLLMMVIGIPMYVCASASTPIAAGFMLAGVSPGTALVFLMAGPATNISTLGVISQELGKRPLIAYLTGVGVIALIAGLTTDALIESWGIDIQSQLHHGHDMLPIWLSGGSLLVLIAFGLWHAYKGRVSMFA